MVEDPTRINQLLDFIFSYGPFWVYLALFVACFAENVFPPFPGDSFIVAAGALVAVNRLDLEMAIIIIMAGGLASVMLIYLFGVRYGRDFFMEKDYRYFSAKDIVNVERKFEKWGPLILVISRFVVGFRSALALVAGISRYQPFKMLVYSAISYALFTGLLMYAAMKFVEHLEVVKEYFRTYNLIIWPVLIIVVAFYIIRRFKMSREGKR
ncbi:MAG: DedA family protein [Candidatus Zixiibacteriota bacterium]